MHSNTSVLSRTCHAQLIVLISICLALSGCQQFSHKPNQLAQESQAIDADNPTEERASELSATSSASTINPATVAETHRTPTPPETESEPTQAESKSSNKSESVASVNQLPASASSTGFPVVSLQAKEQTNQQQSSSQTALESDAPSFTELEPPAELRSQPLKVELAPNNKLQDEHEQSEYKDIWERIRAGYKLDLSIDNPRIDVQFKWYARNQSYLTRVFTRSAKYMHYIVEQLDAHDMPMELALLPVVESAFDPFAYSHGRASGLWQFIPGTGKIYGLKQNWWYDGRRDVAASTQAAIDYLSSLQQRFGGNWMHALASYNTGSGRVSKAIRNNKKKGKPTDFWNLKLPRETRAYVPKLLAISKLVAEPEKYGITLPEIPNEPVFEKVTFKSQLDLAQAANLAELDMETLYFFNPGFNQWATPPTGPHRLLLPIKNAQKFREGLAKLPKEQRLTWNRYSVRSGDSLIKIAKKFNTTPKVIKEVNRLRSNTIRVKQKLLIPSASKGQQYYGLSAANRLSSKQQRISAPKNSTKITHKVRSGDTLWDLSLAHNVSMRKIAKWNGMAPTDVLKPGTELLIYSRKQASTATETTPYIPPQREMIKKVGYRVRRGDSLARIAGKFGVSINEIVKWNKLDRKKYLQPGQRLTLYVDITQS